jgi:hypothetical protein
MSRPTDILQISAEIKRLINEEFTIAKGYSNDWPAGHTYNIFTPAHSGMQKDQDYPKCFVLVDGGTDKKKPARQVESEDYITIILVKKLKGKVQDNVLNQHDDALVMVEDFKRFIRTNYNLGDMVQDFYLIDWSTDGGFAHPEAVVLFKTCVEYWTLDQG